VLDVHFTAAERVSVWNELGPIDLRVASAAERAVIEDRIGELASWLVVFLLTTGSIENYVIAGRVYWAEYELAAQAPSPLGSQDREYRELNPPLNGVVHFAE
jgi:hypothetical protein